MVYMVQHEKNIEFGKPTGFCSMTFPVMGTETSGINDYLWGDFSSAEGQTNFGAFKIKIWPSIIN
jgi:hypothetical protein